MSKINRPVAAIKSLRFALFFLHSISPFLMVVLKVKQSESSLVDVVREFSNFVLVHLSGLQTDIIVFLEGWVLSVLNFSVVKISICVGKVAQYHHRSGCVWPKMSI